MRYIGFMVIKSPRRRLSHMEKLDRAQDRRDARQREAGRRIMVEMAAKAAAVRAAQEANAPKWGRR